MSLIVSWSAILAIVIEILKQRAAAGWPLLKMILEYFGGKIQADADEDTSPMVVGAAPDEVKNIIVAWLEKQQAAARPIMKGVYAMVIRFVPLIADQIWDSLFTAGHVAVPLSNFTPSVFGTAPETEEEILAD